MANIREGYFRFQTWHILFQGNEVHFRLPKKCYVLAIKISMWDWLLIRFWGSNTLIKKAFFSKFKLGGNLKEYCQGYFHSIISTGTSFYLVLLQTHIYECIDKIYKLIFMLLINSIFFWGEAVWALNLKRKVAIVV